MLEYLLELPEDAGDGMPVIILLHGRGSDESDLAGLRPGLPAGHALLTPRAPFPAAAWRYGPGWAWYRYLSEDRVDAESLSASLDALDELLDGLPALLGFTPGRLALGGFSQGGTVSIAYALTRSGPIADILCFSGFVPAHPSVLVDAGTVEGGRFFWGHGTRDDRVPFARAERGRAALRHAGADLYARDYAIGHWIDPRELADAGAWLDGAPGAARPRGPSP